MPPPPRGNGPRSRPGSSGPGTSGTGSAGSSTRPAAAAVSRQSQRRFARRQWKRRFRGLRPAFIATAVVLVIGFVVWAVNFSHLLDVREVRVEGLTAVSGLTSSNVESAASVVLGEPLAKIDISAVRQKVSRLRPIRSVEVSQSWPHDVVIRVIERKPAAIWRSGSMLRYVDASGFAFRTVSEIPAGMSVFTLGEGVDEKTGATLRAVGAKVARALPRSLSARVASIHVGSPDAVSLKLSGGAIVMWGNAEKSVQKARVLSSLLRQPAKAYDVSVPAFPTVQTTSR